MKKQLIDLNLLSIFKKNCDSEYQDKLMFDTFPVLDSLNPITSGGVYAALAGCCTRCCQEQRGCQKQQNCNRNGLLFYRAYILHLFAFHLCFYACFCEFSTPNVLFFNTHSKHKDIN